MVPESPAFGPQRSMRRTQERSPEERAKQRAKDHCASDGVRSRKCVRCPVLEIKRPRLETHQKAVDRLHVEGWDRASQEWRNASVPPLTVDFHAIIQDREGNGARN